MSALHPGVHVLSCPTRWSDVDENGHINNARLVGYVQEGIYDMFCHHETAVRDALFPSGFIIARHEIDFLEQLYHRPEPLSVQLTVERIGRSSTHIVVDVCRAPLTFMRARTVVVARDRESGRSRKLSSNERSFLEAFMPDEVRVPAAQAVPAAPTAPAAPAAPVAAPPPQRVAARSGAALPHRTRRRCRASVA
ncbi:acyl-CoA thioesterase [Kitasatospora sp. NBC_01300]|uniref:acyl-CoA thioesterase n=1 Tax=Kitasatospora sp. NBC_01300 TaxID=2903574 RepID=UPI00352E6347|nr:thioesterase family protein [Kitasatospora sp. NBC_01300]